jgi:hypothetical protein
MITIKRLAAAVAVILMTLAAMPATAVIVPVANRAALNGDLTVEWDIFGPDGTTIVTPDSRTVGPLEITVSSSQGMLNRVDGGFGFAANEPLLRDANSQSDSFIVRFDPNVQGFGFELQATVDFGSFTGTVDVFNDNDVLLGDIPFAGDTAGAPIFVGALSDADDIGPVTIEVDQPINFFPPQAGTAAINRLDVVLQQVPEPGTLALLATGLAGLGAAARRRRKS